MQNSQPSGAGTSQEPARIAALLDVRAVAALLGCSVRHVYRLAYDGQMPPPVRLGQLVRWRRAELLDWIAAGCPATAKPKAVRP